MSLDRESLLGEEQKKFLAMSKGEKRNVFIAKIETVMPKQEGSLRENFRIINL